MPSCPRKKMRLFLQTLLIALFAAESSVGAFLRLPSHSGRAVTNADYLLRHAYDALDFGHSQKERSLGGSPASTTRPPSRSITPLHVLTTRVQADFTEMMVGGERYSMVPMPDSMVDSTIFVGNLCEFANDRDLSELFHVVTSLCSVPACVVRKPDTSSMQYGFVSFRNVQEKEVGQADFALWDQFSFCLACLRQTYVMLSSLGRGFEVSRTSVAWKEAKGGINT